MKAARITFAAAMILLVGLSVAAVWHVGGNRMKSARACELYRTWVEFDKQGKSGSFGPIASMESKCNDTWLTRLNRNMEWHAPWR